MSCSPEWIDTISSGQATFISAKQATLHYINTGLTERYSFVSFEGKKAINAAQYHGEHRTTRNVKRSAFLLKEVLVILFYLLPPNLSSISVDNNTFRNMGISQFYPHRYMNRYIYRYSDQIFLFNKAITSHYQETKKTPNNPKSKDLLSALSV